MFKPWSKFLPETCKWGFAISLACVVILMEWFCRDLVLAGPTGLKASGWLDSLPSMLGSTALVLPAIFILGLDPKGAALRFGLVFAAIVWAIALSFTLYTTEVSKVEGGAFGFALTSLVFCVAVGTVYFYLFILGLAFRLRNEAAD
jgi:hypothetical protein